MRNVIFNNKQEDSVAGCKRQCRKRNRWNAKQWTIWGRCCSGQCYASAVSCPATHSNSCSIVHGRWCNWCWNDGSLEQQWRWVIKNDNILYYLCRYYINFFVFWKRKREFELSLAIFAFILRFSLSMVAQKALLDLIHIVLAANQTTGIPKSIHQLHKIVGFENVSIVTKSFCEECSKPLSPEMKCTYDKCNQKQLVALRSDIFSFVDFSAQLRSLIRNNFSAINDFLCNTHDIDFIDIIDGHHYRQIQQQNRLNLLVYTDGVQVAESSLLNCWPVVLSLVELPCRFRNSIQNKIVCGIWFGKKKPTSDVLFESTTSLIDTINETGIEVLYRSIRFKLTIGLYGLVVDTPARSLCMMVMNFNGEYGCPYCLNAGKYNINASVFLKIDLIFWKTHYKGVMTLQPKSGFTTASSMKKKHNRLTSVVLAWGLRQHLISGYKACQSSPSTSVFQLRFHSTTCI